MIGLDEEADPGPTGSYERLRILLGVSGGIAAFKAPQLVRLLQERGHEVRAALTRNAPSFVAPLTLEVLTGHRVYGDDYLGTGNSGEELHLTVAQWMDVLCVAPATCNALARLAVGLCDDFLTTTAIAFEGPVVIAPAMDSVMWRHPAVQRHIETLQTRGAYIVGPDVGRLASGETGIGRMTEPEEIVLAVESTRRKRDLVGRTVLVTAGPTREPLDPVRFISSRSSGRMGFALASEAADRSARVVLVCGPVSLATPRAVERVDVTSAEEMLAAVTRWAPEADLVVMTAAVADFRPRNRSPNKMQKRTIERIDLTSTPDILKSLERLAPQALRVGFAAETDDIAARATAKLDGKGAHFIIANDVSSSDVGIAAEDNEVTVFSRHRPPLFIERQPKRLLAGRLIDLLVVELEERDRKAIATPG